MQRSTTARRPTPNKHKLATSRPQMGTRRCEPGRVFDHHIQPRLSHFLTIIPFTSTHGYRYCYYQCYHMLDCTFCIIVLCPMSSTLPHPTIEQLLLKRPNRRKRQAGALASTAYVAAAANALAACASQCERTQTPKRSDGGRSTQDDTQTQSWDITRATCAERHRAPRRGRPQEAPRARRAVERVEHRKGRNEGRNGSSARGRCRGAAAPPSSRACRSSRCARANRSEVGALCDPETAAKLKQANSRGAASVNDRKGRCRSVSRERPSAAATGSPTRGRHRPSNSTVRGPASR